MIDHHEARSMGDGFIGYCDDCCGPIAPKSAFELVRDALIFDLLMTLPTWFMMGTRIGYAMLPFAGSHAYTCTCPAKCRVEHNDQPCHADVLLELANAPTTGESHA